MNKKIILFAGILFVSLLAINSVSAAQYVTHDFDGYFTMQVPDDVTFQKDVNTAVGENNFITYQNENIVIMYCDSFFVSENSSTYFIQTIFEELNPDLSTCHESQEDGLLILEPTTNNDLNFITVGKCSGNKVLIIVGDDLELIKGMAKSAKFN